MELIKSLFKKRKNLEVLEQKSEIEYVNEEFLVEQLKRIHDKYLENKEALEKSCWESMFDWFDFKSFLYDIRKNKIVFIDYGVLSRIPKQKLLGGVNKRLESMEMLVYEYNQKERINKALKKNDKINKMISKIKLWK